VATKTSESRGTLVVVKRLSFVLILLMSNP
jgi:hypothetical protein